MFSGKITIFQGGRIEDEKCANSLEMGPMLFSTYEKMPGVMSIAIISVVTTISFYFVYQ